MRYAVIYEKTQTGYSAHAPDLPGCVAAGSTLAETQRLMRGAIEMHLEGMREDGASIPPPRTLADYLMVKAPPRIARMKSARHASVGTGTTKKLRSR
jgi:predicted RNase H-like HicB family nuclease